MMGLHGNGLTALVWMKPTPQSTVIEFLYPGGFAYDYEFTARALGMVHYGVWDDKYVSSPFIVMTFAHLDDVPLLVPADLNCDRTFTNPDLPPVQYPEGFQGNNIPLDGETVAKLCMERLQLGTSANN